MNGSTHFDRQVGVEAWTNHCFQVMQKETLPRSGVNILHCISMSLQRDDASSQSRVIRWTSWTPHKVYGAVKSSSVWSNAPSMRGSPSNEAWTLSNESRHSVWISSNESLCQCLVSSSSTGIWFKICKCTLGSLSLCLGQVCSSWIWRGLIWICELSISDPSKESWHLTEEIKL